MHRKLGRQTIRHLIIICGMLQKQRSLGLTCLWGKESNLLHWVSGKWHFLFFWDLNEIKHAKYLTQGLTHNIFSINMHHSSLSCVTLSIIVCLTFVPWEVEFCHLDIPSGGLGTMLEGGKKRVFISPAPQLWASVLAGAAFLFLWPSSNPEDPLP